MTEVALCREVNLVLTKERKKIVIIVIYYRELNVLSIKERVNNNISEIYFYYIIIYNFFLFTHSKKNN